MLWLAQLVDFSLLHPFPFAFVFFLPHCLEGGCLNAAIHFCWWMLTSSHASFPLRIVLLVVRSKLVILGIPFWTYLALPLGPLPELLENPALVTACRDSLQLPAWASLQRPEWNTGGHRVIFLTAPWLKMLDRDLRVFFPQLCVTDLQQTILSFLFLSVATIEMFFLSPFVCLIYLYFKVFGARTVSSLYKDWQTKALTLFGIFEC